MIWNWVITWLPSSDPLGESFSCHLCLGNPKYSSDYSCGFKPACYHRGAELGTNHLKNEPGRKEKRHPSNPGASVSICSENLRAKGASSSTLLSSFIKESHTQTPSLSLEVTGNQSIQYLGCKANKKQCSQKREVAKFHSLLWRRQRSGSSGLRNTCPYFL